MSGIDGEWRMRKYLRNIIPLALIAAALGGCESQEPTAATPAATATAPALDNQSADERMATIEAMYAGYRVEAFADVPDIRVSELAVLESETPVLLVDCREDYERAVSVIPGAVTKAEFEADAERYRDHLIVTYCTIGYRSGVFAREIIGRDYDAVNLVGGVLAWAHEGHGFVDPEGGETKRVHVYGPTWDLLPVGYEPVFEEDSTP